MTAPSSSLLNRLAAVLGDRYVVEKEIGSGGMAIVFAAHDVRHSRRVAVKVLRPELAASLGSDRFLREITLAAGLQHPHILPVYDSGAGDGLLYYVMPFVEGEALSERIARDGPLPVEEAVRFAREIAGALSAAHARGIVHRDVKPDNIMLSGGHALVADFGIARAATVADTRLTATGMAVGTPLYMSPEQALGATDVDARADIYSLGCVLFEMLTGRQPFSGSSLQAIIAQSITAPRPRARKLRPDTPRALDDIVSRALAKEPSDRFPTADAMDAALASMRVTPAAGWRLPLAFGAAIVALLLVLGAGWTWRLRRADAGNTTGVSADARVIAVLPFTTAGGAGALGVSAIGEGLVDLLSTNLDGVGGIRTVDVHAVMRGWRARAGTDSAVDRAGALAVGRTLGAGSVLTGNVVTVGTHVRMNAELTNVRGEMLARAQADGTPESMLALVDTLSVRLLRDVWRSSSPVPELRVSALTTGSLPAMRAYLDGESQLRRSDWAAAGRSYATAIEHDSAFGLAYLRLLTTYDWLRTDLEGADLVTTRLRGRLGQLPARERALAVGTIALHTSSLAVMDTALALVTRYPDWLDAWMMLGEARFHTQGILASTDEEVRAPFERVLGLDPSRVSVYEHLLDLSAFAGDSTTFFRDMTRLRDVTGADSTLARYTDLGTALWGAPVPASEAMRRFTKQFDGLHQTLVKSAAAVPGAAARLSEVLSRIPGPVGDSLQASRAELLLAGLHVTAAREVTAVAITRLPLMGIFYDDLMMPLMLGLGDQTASFALVRAGIHTFGTRSFARVLSANLGVITRDTTLVRNTLETAYALDTTTLKPSTHAILEAIAGWQQITLGDSAEGAEIVGQALKRTDYGLEYIYVPPRFVRAVTLSRRAASRAEGIRLLRYGFRDDPAWIGPALLALHEAELDAGDPHAAVTAARVKWVWAGADPDARQAAQHMFPRGFTP